MIWLCLLVLLVSWSPRFTDRNEFMARLTMQAVMIGLLLAAFSPNPWLAVWITVVSVGVWRTPIPSDRLPLVFWPALLWVVPYVALAPHVTAEWVAPVLAAIVACGLMLSAWVAFSLYIGEREYDRCFTWNGTTFLHLYERLSDGPTGGQNNPNHVHAISALSTAAGLGLAMLWSPWAILLAVGCVFPIAARDLSLSYQQPIQGFVYLMALAVAGFTLLYGWVVLAVAALLAVVVAILARRHTAWSKRLEFWKFAVRCWGRLSWKGKLIGGGLDSWSAYLYYGKPFGDTATFGTAHNEFLQALVEHGLIGMLAMIGYAVTTLWALSHGSLEAQAVFLIGVVLVVCATISFPLTMWSLMFIQQDDGGIHRLSNGNTALNVMSLAIITLGEVR